MMVVRALILNVENVSFSSDQFLRLCKPDAGKPLNAEQRTGLAGFCLQCRRNLQILPTSAGTVLLTVSDGIRGMPTKGTRNTRD